MYNACLRKGVFPKRWTTAKLIPIVKPGKENSDEVSKFRPINLLNTGGKVLEKLLINRITHHVLPAISRTKISMASRLKGIPQTQPWL